MRSFRDVLLLCGIVTMACLTIVSSRVQAASLDGSTPILCVFTNATGCDGISGCEQTTIEDLNLPRFFKIDFKKNQFIPVGVNGEIAAAQETKIKDFQRMDGKIFLQGIELRGWSMVITEQTGKMSLTASGDDEAFVLFGVCIPQ